MITDLSKLHWLTQPDVLVSECHWLNNPIFFEGFLKDLEMLILPM